MDDVKQFPNTAIILGGNLSSERREDALAGRKPRVDVMEMELQFPARLFDFTWLEAQAKNELSTRILLSVAKRLGFWSEILSLRVLRDARKYDAIYATGEDVGMPLAALLRLFNYKRPYFVLRMEQPVFGRTPLLQTIYKKLMRFSLARINVVFTRTEAHAEYLKKNYHLGNTKVCFLPETTDAVFFDPTIQKQHLSRLEFLSKPYIVTAGLEQRDYESLIEAVKGLPVNLLICAGSPWAKVRFNPANDDFPENIRVDSFGQLEMREIYRDAEFVVLPIKPTARACGMNVILEAWAMGKAVVASQTEGLNSYIREGTDGLFVEPEDVLEFRNSITYLLNNPEEVSRLGQNGYLRMSQELIMENYIETIRETILQQSRKLV